MSDMTFSGTTAECLVDFGTRYPGMESRKLLSQFCKVVVHPTTRDWISGAQVPKGEPLLRARCFLSLAGYKVREYEELPDVTRQFMLLIATDVVSIEEAQRELNYGSVDGIYDVTLRGRSPVQDRFFRLTRLVNQRGDELREPLEKWHVEIEAALADWEPPPDQQRAEVQAVSVIRQSVSVHRASNQGSFSTPRQLDSTEVPLHLVLALDGVLSTLDEISFSKLREQTGERLSPDQLERLGKLFG